MDKQTFQKEVLLRQEMLYRISKTICFSDSDCEDAVQNALLKAFANLKKLRDERYFSTWLVRIVINECHTVNKKNRRTVNFEEYLKSEKAENEHVTELYEAIARLPEKMRIAVELHYIEGYSVEETAEILGVPSGTVKSRLASGRKQIKMYMEE